MKNPMKKVELGSMLKPIKIGKMEVKNRVVMSPMDFKYVTGNYSEATMTRRMTDLLQARAKGGVGLIFTSHVKAEQKLDPFPKSLLFPIMDRDERIKEFAEVADAIHLYGAKIAAELSPGSGRYADELEGEDIVSASAVPTQYHPGLMTRALTKDEIDYLLDCYGKAAGRLKAAGFDAICIHCSCGYLIGQFLSPAWNHRTDEYGGSEENRMRFLIECIESAKRHVGDDFPILLSITVDEKLENINWGTLTTGEAVDTSQELPDFGPGITPDYAIKVAQTLEGKGYVDAYHVRIGNYYNQEHIIPSSYSTNEEYTEAIIKFKSGVTKPVIFDNKLSDPVAMQKMIDEGTTDMVSMGRQWIAEPEWVKKAERCPEEIRPCIRCMMCLETTWKKKYGECAVNPQFGREGEPLVPTIEPKNILVIGGGPGGMMAALTAAKRGHWVTLAEKKDHLGGRLPEAGANSYKAEIMRYSEWLKRQIEKSQVKVEYNVQASVAYVEQKNPDAVIIAAGANPIIPKVPGYEKGLLAEEILTDLTKTGKRVVVVGGGLVGCEVADKLVGQGKEVTLVEMRPEVLMDTSVIYRHAALKKMETMDATIMTGTALNAINDEGVIVNENQQIVCDDVVWAVGFKADSGLYRELYEMLDEVYVIGDNRAAGKVFNAVQEGYRIAAEI